MSLLGDSGLRSSYPDLATFYVWQLPFYLIGLFFFFKEKQLGELKFFTIMLLLIAPIPAAVTGDPYNTNRSIPLVIPQLIIISFGILKFYGYLSKELKPFAIGLAALVILHSILILWSSAIILNEHYRGALWNYGWQEVVTTLESQEDKNIPVLVDSSRGEGAIQLAFFLKYNPTKYQQENFEVPVSEYYTNMTRRPIKTVGRYTIREINWEKDFDTDQYIVGDLLLLSDPEVAKQNVN